MSRMHNTFVSALAVTVTLAVSACGDSSSIIANEDTNVAGETVDVNVETTDVNTGTADAGTRPDQQVSVMDQAVDFSTPEEVKKSFQKIQEQAGDAAVENLQNALNYMLFYDLGVGRDINRLYKKLDGKTPNEIIAVSAK